MLQATYCLEVSVLRLANVFGPGGRVRVIPIWLDRARRGEDLELFGGEQVIDFVPVALVVAALRRAAEIDLGNQSVNVGSGVGTSLKSLAARVHALPGIAVGMRILPARSVEVTRFVADTSRMRNVLSLESPGDPLADLEVLWHHHR